MVRRHTPHWTTYVGALLVLTGLAWQLATAWFDVQSRLRVLEEKQQYLHGEWSLQEVRHR